VYMYPRMLGDSLASISGPGDLAAVIVLLVGLWVVASAVAARFGFMDELARKLYGDRWMYNPHLILKVAALNLMIRVLMLFFAAYMLSVAKWIAEGAETMVVREFVVLSNDIGGGLVFFVALAWRILSVEWRFALARAAGLLSVILSVLLIILVAATLLSKLLALLPAAP